MTQPTTRRTAIIGGGLSGLATAVKLHLAAPDRQITILEGSDRVGGVIDTIRVDDFLIDRGADMFATKPPAALDFLKQLGVADELILPKKSGRGARIVHKGQLVDLPDGFVLMRATKLGPLLTTPLLSWAGKLRFLRERFVGRVTGQEDASGNHADISVAEFVSKRLGRETLDNLVGPLVAGIYTADVHQLSMEATMGPLAAMEREYGSLAKATAARRRNGLDAVERDSSGARYEQFRAFRGGMIELIKTLREQLPETCIRTNSHVTQLEQTDSGWTVSVNDQTESFDDVVVAIPPAAAAKLLGDVCPAGSETLASIKAASTAIAVLVVHRDQIKADINTFGFVVPPKENRKILAASFASNKFAGRAPDDHVIVRVFIGGMLQPELLKQDDDALIALASRELADLIGLSGDPKVSRVVRWNNAMPQYHVGHKTRVAKIEDEIDKLPDLYLTNNAMHGVGIAPVIQAADNLVKKIIAPAD